jgi:ribosomal protein S18 acetylase RimI-like enzyme
MQVNYRTPEMIDVQDLAELHVRCWQQAYFGIIDDGFLQSLSVEQRLAGWQRSLADEEVFKLAAYFQNAPIGFICSGPARETSHADGEIYALYLDRQFHGRGIGFSLCNDATQNWRGRKGESLAVNVLAENHRARHFYERFGFATVGDAEWKSNSFTLPEKVLKLSF